MAKNSGIQWTDDTLNALVGCSKCSIGCLECYATNDILRMDDNPRFGAGERNLYHGIVEQNPTTGKWNWTGRLRFFPHRLYSVFDDHQNLRKFTNSLSDMFHERLPLKIILEHFRIFGMTPWLQYQILTKRADNLLKLSPKIEWPRNAWMGVSVCSGTEVELRRIDLLGGTDAWVKFISFEPWVSHPTKLLRDLVPDLATRLKRAGIKWGIIGGESNKLHKFDARPVSLDDFKFLAESLWKADARVFLKQLGTRWALDSGTWGTMTSKGDRAEKVNSGGNPDLWPKDFRKLSRWRQYPANEIITPYAKPTGVIPTADPEDWRKWSTAEMEETVAQARQEKLCQIGPVGS